MYYYPAARAALKKWLANFKLQFGTIGPKMQEPADRVAEIQSTVDKLLAAMNQADEAKLDWQRLHAASQALEESIGEEIRALVSHLKTSPFYSVENGNLLKIISTTAAVDLSDYTPVLTVKQSGGRVIISFKKHGADGMNIYTRLEGETTWTLLANAKVSPFTDPRLLAKANTPEVREYCAMATLQNVEVGHRSEVVSIKYIG